MKRREATPGKETDQDFLLVPVAGIPKRNAVLLHRSDGGSTRLDRPVSESSPGNLCRIAEPASGRRPARRKSASSAGTG